MQCLLLPKKSRQLIDRKVREQVAAAKPKSSEVLFSPELTALTGRGPRRERGRTRHRTQVDIWSKAAVEPDSKGCGRTTLTYKFHPRVQAGIEYNPRASEFKPLANILVLTETRRRPALMVGTSTDRIGTPSGQSFYATFSKNLQRETGLPIAPYVGVSYGTLRSPHRGLLAA